MTTSGAATGGSGSASTAITGPDLDVLRRAGLLERIPEEDVEALLPKFVPVSVPRGNVIFREREVDDGKVYVVLDGRVGLERRDDRDHSTMLAVLGPSEMFGELSALDPGQRTSTATALMPTRLAMLPAEDLLEWATHRPVIARQLLRVLARRLRRTNDTVASMVFVDVPGRVAGAVLDLAGRFGEPTDQGLRVKHALTQDQLAQLVGASRETVNKVLANFSSRGWLTLESRSLVLRDIEAVRKRARQAATGTSR